MPRPYDLTGSDLDAVADMSTAYEQELRRYISGSLSPVERRAAYLAGGGDPSRCGDTAPVTADNEAFRKRAAVRLYLSSQYGRPVSDLEHDGYRDAWFGEGATDEDAFTMVQAHHTDVNLQELLPSTKPPRPTSWAIELIDRETQLYPDRGEYPLEKQFFRSIKGNVTSQVGGWTALGLSLAGQKDAAKAIADLAAFHASYYEPSPEQMERLQAFSGLTLEKLFSPEWWAIEGGSATATRAIFLIAGVVIMGGLGGAIGNPVVRAAAAGGLTGAAVEAPMEGGGVLIEAANRRRWLREQTQVLEDYLQGLPPEERAMLINGAMGEALEQYREDYARLDDTKLASKYAHQIFRRNVVMLAVSNALQFGMGAQGLRMAIGKRVGAILASLGIIVADQGVEQLEEQYQESWSRESAEAWIVGRAAKLDILPGKIIGDLLSGEPESVDIAMATLLQSGNSMVVTAYSEWADLKTMAEADQKMREFTGALQKRADAGDQWAAARLLDLKVEKKGVAGLAEYGEKLRGLASRVIGKTRDAVARTPAENVSRIDPDSLLDEETRKAADQTVNEMEQDDEALDEIYRGFEQEGDEATTQVEDSTTPVVEPPPIPSDNSSTQGATEGVQKDYAAIGRQDAAIGVMNTDYAATLTPEEWAQYSDAYLLARDEPPIPVTMQTEVLPVDGEDAQSESDGQRVARVLQEKNPAALPVRVISESQIPDAVRAAQQSGKRTRGWVDTTTGEIFVVEGRDRDWTAIVADIVEQWGHEQGHVGMDILFDGDSVRRDAFLAILHGFLDADAMAGLYGKTGRDAFLASLHGLLDADAMAGLYGKTGMSPQEIADQPNKADAVVVAEYLARMAGKVAREGGEALNARQRTIWEQVQALVREWVRKIGRGLRLPAKLTDEDVNRIAVAMLKAAGVTDTNIDEDVARKTKKDDAPKARTQTDELLKKARAEVGKVYFSPEDRRELAASGVPWIPRYFTGDKTVGMSFDEAATYLASHYPGFGVDATAGPAEVAAIFRGSTARQATDGSALVRANDLDVGDKFEGASGATEVVISKHDDGSITTTNGILRTYGPEDVATEAHKVGVATEEELAEANEKAPELPIEDVEKLDLPAVGEDVFFSVGGERIRTATDTDYLAAVEAGDTATAQRMVDEAAKVAGYGDKMYHGTRAERFNVFKTTGKGKTSGAGAFFTANEENAKTYGPTVYGVFLKEDGPRLDAEGQNWNALKVWEAYDREGDPLGEFTSQAEAESKAGPEGSVIDYAVTISEDGAYLDRDYETDEPATSTDSLAALARERGYGSIRFDNIVDSASPVLDFGLSDKARSPSSMVAVFSPSQIKSADPVTRDDAGNVIPLSERFDQASDDIRFSISDDEQMDLFADQWSAASVRQKASSIVDAQPLYIRPKTRAEVAWNHVHNAATAALKAIEGGSPAYGRILRQIQAAEAVASQEIAKEAKARLKSPDAMQQMTLFGDAEKPKQGVLFSIEDGPPLVAAHNMTGANVLFADSMGGLAMPSLGITNADDPYVNFGEITLLGEPDMVDPRKGGKMRVANADQYSPRHPPAVHNMNKGVKRVWARIQAWVTETYGESLRDEDYAIRSILYGAGSHFESTRGDFSSRGLDGLHDDTGLQAYYAGTTLGRVFRDTDKWSTRGELEDLIKEHDAEYSAWLNETFGPFIERRLFKGYTPSGNRRYGPYTIDVVMQYMRKEMRSGEGEGHWYSVGSVRSKVAKHYRTLKQVMADRGKIGTRKDIQALKDVANERLQAIAEDGRKAFNSPRDLGHAETFWSVVLDVVGKSPARAREICKDYRVDYDQMPWDDIRQFLDELRDMPTEYFEAKLERVVSLREFKAAVVPSSLPAAVRDVLKRAGVPMVEYDEATDGARAQAVAAASKAHEIQFSISDHKDQMVDISDRMARGAATRDMLADQVRLFDALTKRGPKSDYVDHNEVKGKRSIPDDTMKPRRQTQDEFARERKARTGFDREDQAYAALALIRKYDKGGTITNQDLDRHQLRDWSRISFSVGENMKLSTRERTLAGTVAARILRGQVVNERAVKQRLRDIGHPTDNAAMVLAEGTRRAEQMKADREEPGKDPTLLAALASQDLRGRYQDKVKAAVGVGEDQGKQTEQHYRKLDLWEKQYRERVAAKRHGLTDKELAKAGEENLAVRMSQAITDYAPKVKPEPVEEPALDPDEELDTTVLTKPTDSDDFDAAARPADQADEREALEPIPRELPTDPAVINDLKRTIQAVAVLKLAREGYVVAVDADGDIVLRKEVAATWARLIRNAAWENMQAGGRREWVREACRELELAPGRIPAINRRVSQLTYWVARYGQQATAETFAKRLDKLLRLERVKGKTSTRDEMIQRKIDPLVKAHLRMVRDVYRISEDRADELRIQLTELTDEVARGNIEDDQARERLASMMPSTAAEVVFKGAPINEVLEDALRAVLQYGAIKTRPVAEIAEKVQQLQDDYRNGIERIAQIRQDRSDRLAPGRSAIIEGIRQLPEQRQEGIRAMIRNTIQGNMDWYNLMMDLVRSAKGVAHEQAAAAIKGLSLKVNTSYDDYDAHILKYRQALSGAIEQIYQTKGVEAVLRDLDREQEGLAKFSRGRERLTKLSRGQALHLVAALEQKHYVENGVLHGRDAEYLAELRGALSPQDLALLDWLRGWYEGERAELDAKSREILGIPLVSPDPLYHPVRVARQTTGLAEKHVVLQLVPGSFEARRRHRWDIDETVSVIDLFHQYSDGNARFLAYAELGQDLRFTFGHAEMRRVLGQIAGGRARHMVIEYVTDIARGGASHTDDVGLEAVNKLRAFTTLAIMSWNAGAGFRQLAGLAGFGIYDVGLTGIGASIGRSVANPDAWHEAWNELREHPAFKVWADHGYSEAVDNAMSASTTNPVIKVMRMGMFVQRMGINAAVALVAPGLYMAKVQSLRKAYGLSTDAAKTIARNEITWLVQHSQGSSRTDMMPHVWRKSGAIGKAFSQFMGPLIPLNATQMRSAREMLSGAPGGKKRLANVLVLNHIIAPGIYMLAKVIWEAIRGDWRDDPEEWAEDTAKETLAMMLAGPMAGTLLWGTLAESIIYSVVAGWRSDGGAAPSGRIAGQWIEGGINLFKHLTTDFDMEQALEDMDKIAGALNPAWRDASKAIKNYSD